MKTLNRSIVPALLAGLLTSGPSVAAEEPDCMNYRDNRSLDARAIQLCEALSIKQRYLDGVTFIEDLPPGSSGQVLDAHKESTSHFTTSGTSEIGGTVTIGTLTGKLRFTLATTDNTLYYGRKVRVSGTVSVGEGRLAIYSPVDVDFWEMAALFVDDPIRGEPTPEGLTLKGYLVTEIIPGPAKPFSAELMAYGGDYKLLLGAPDGEASGIEIEIGNE